MTMTANQLLESAWDGRLPVDLRAMAYAVGRVALKGGSPNGGSALISRSEDGTVIEYSTSDDVTRQRFAIAHCLGHYALGQLPATGTRSVSSTNFSLRADSSEDQAANNFALELLMPEKTLRFAVENRGITDVVKLSTAFGVSQVAMKERLIQVGLIKRERARKP